MTVNKEIYREYSELLSLWVPLTDDKTEAQRRNLLKVTKPMSHINRIQSSCY